MDSGRTPACSSWRTLAARTSRWRLPFGVVRKNDAAARAERLAQLVTDLVAARTDAGAQRDDEVLRPRAARLEGAHGLARDAPDRPAPAGVGSGHRSPHGVDQQDRQTVRGLDAEQQPRRGRDGGVRLGRLVPGREGDRAAVHLSQQLQLSVRVEPGADAPHGLVARLGVGARGAPPEAVHEARDRGERFDLSRSFHSLAHASSGGRTTLSR